MSDAKVAKLFSSCSTACVAKPYRAFISAEFLPVASNCRRSYRCTRSGVASAMTRGTGAMTSRPLPLTSFAAETATHCRRQRAYLARNPSPNGARTGPRPFFTGDIKSGPARLAVNRPEIGRAGPVRRNPLRSGLQLQCGVARLIN